MLFRSDVVYAIVQGHVPFDNRTEAEKTKVAWLPTTNSVVTQPDLTAIPDGVDPKDSSWFALAKIAAMGARAAQYGMADSALILGAGPIGQMAVRWAHALGVETVLALDPQGSRLEWPGRAGPRGSSTAGSRTPWPISKNPRGAWAHGW